MYLKLYFILALNSELNYICQNSKIMRKTTLAILLFFVLNNSFSQNWLDVGLKGGYGAGLLMNSNIWDDPLYNHELTGTGNFGAKLGFNFNEEHEVTFDAMFGSFIQNFKYDIELASATDTSVLVTEAHKSSLTFKSTNLIFMYRHNNDGRYGEIGPQVTIISSSSRTDDFSGATAFDQSHFEKFMVGMSAGFGAYVMGTENFGITAGFRFSYMFTDLISENGKLVNQPTLKKYDSYKGSYPLYFQLVFEANLDFAYLAKANCGRRKLLTF